MKRVYIILFILISYTIFCIFGIINIKSANKYWNENRNKYLIETRLNREKENFKADSIFILDKNATSFYYLNGHCILIEIPNREKLFENNGIICIYYKNSNKIPEIYKDSNYLQSKIISIRDQIRYLK